MAPAGSDRPQTMAFPSIPPPSPRHAAFRTDLPAALTMAVFAGRCIVRLVGLINGGEARESTTAFLRRDSNTLERPRRENHKSKHISSPTPFLFLPVRLSQRLAQV